MSGGKKKAQNHHRNTSAFLQPGGFTQLVLPFAAGGGRALESPCPTWGNFPGRLAVMFFVACFRFLLAGGVERLCFLISLIVFF